jgi:hypothetical protein
VPPPWSAPTGIWRRRVAELGRAVASDVTLHGFVYLGVLLTFVGLLGFLLFAFKDVPSDVQPLVEFAVPVVLFAWAWVLRRQRAVRVGQAMELLGAVVLPLVAFASLVDGSPYPPNLQGPALVVGMTVIALVTAGLYAGWSRRHRDSPLRYLVLPMVWLAAMTAGFAFKADEPLLGDAITRLVSPQPALAAAAIALTLVSVAATPRLRLVGPIRLAALPGAGVAYLLTLALAAGEGWDRRWPVVLAGAATLVSAELLGAGARRRELLVALRPVLLAATLAPLVPLWGLGWSGVAVVAAFLALLEWAPRAERRVGPDLVAAAGAVVVGLGMSTAVPWAAVTAFALATGWAATRQRVGSGSPTADRVVTLAAGVLPAGLAWSLLAALPLDVGWVVVAAALLGAVGVGRVSSTTLASWGVWSAAAAAVVVLGVLATWQVGDRAVLSAWLLTAALVAAAGVLALGPGWPAARIWATSAAGAAALHLALAAATVSTAASLLVWAAVGLGGVLAAALGRRERALHAAGVGHTVLLGALVAAPAGDVRSLTLVAWTLGWLASVVAGELDRPSFGGLLAATWEGRPRPLAVGVAPAVRVASERATADLVAHAIPVALLVASGPVAWLDLLGRWSAFAAAPSWRGPALAIVALGYAAVTRALVRRRPVVDVLAAAAQVLAVVALLAAVPDRWPLLTTAAAGAGLALLLARQHRSSSYVWFAWSLTGLIAVLVAELLGVPPDLLAGAGIVWGATLLLGALAVDDRRAGRRQPTVWLRLPWLLPPAVLGAAVLPAAFLVLAVLRPVDVGWWSLALAAVASIVAVQLRQGVLSGPAHALAAFGLAVLLPWSGQRRLLGLVGLAALLVATAWVTERLGSRPTDVRLRWDLPPLAVAHALAVVALLAPAETAVDPLTWSAAGLLSLAIAVWRRHRAWVEAGNLLLVIAASAAGPGWLTLALGATAVRGIVAAATTSGTVRVGYHAIGVGAAAAAWVQLALWQTWSVTTLVGTTALVFGALATGVGLGTWLGRVPRDWAIVWGGLAALGVLCAGIGSFGPPGPFRAVGPTTAAGTALLAVGVALAARAVWPPLHHVVVGLVAWTWLTAVLGLQWGAATATVVTAYAFGLLGALTVEVARRRVTGTSAPTVAVPVHALARAWAGLAVAGVAVAAVIAPWAPSPRPAWLAVAAGVALLAVAAARGPDPLRLGWLRELSGVLGLVALTVVGHALGTPAVTVAGVAVAVGVVATLVTVGRWRRDATSPWLRPLAVLGVAATAEAALLAIALQPRRDVLVAVLLGAALQCAAVGLTLRQPAVLSLAPALALGAWFGIVIEGLAGNVLWYSTPIAVVLLAEVDVGRWGRRLTAHEPGTRALLLFEAVGIALLGVAPLTNLFTHGLGAAMLAVGLAVGLLVWGVVTRVRRRVVAGVALATATAVLTIAAVAAGRAPASAEVWIVTAGVGVAVMLVVGLVEASRSRAGRMLRRLEQLTAGWE